MCGGGGGGGGGGGKGGGGGGGGGLGGGGGGSNGSACRFWLVVLIDNGALYKLHFFCSTVLCTGYLVVLLE